MLKKLTTGIAAGVTTAATSARVLGGAGIIRAYPPATLLQLGKTLREWGTGSAGGFISLAVRHPDGIGLIDEVGELTFGEMDRRSNAVARALTEAGVGEGDGVALMCRNHRGFIDVMIGAAKVGADCLFLNTAFAGPQLVEVLERDAPAALVYDEEFAGLVEKADVPTKIVAWTDAEHAPDGSRSGTATAADLDGGARVTLESLIAKHDGRPVAAPERHGRIIILTSGTTGTPKGAPRSEAGVDAAVSLLSGMPLKYGWRTHIAAPLFHTWGFGHLALSMLLGSTMVLRRRFDPEGALRALTEEKCESFVVIPVMLQRILALPQETKDSYDLSLLQVTASSGSALPGDLALEWMDQFGDNLYSTYGSTEVAYASIASPSDLRAAPQSAGRPPYNTVVKILDERGREVAAGASGRIFVGNGLLFEGYTGGGHKEVIDGLMSSGDVGRFGEDGRLYVEGRDDEMIVSGGENVFPKEVEDCIARLDGIDEVACLGVDDDDFGKRLRAFVALSDGASVSEDDVKDWVKQNLARYKVPREVVFLDELPRNATGKVLKRELAQHGQSDAGESDEDSAG